jgi:hypothetical protein
MHYVTDDGITLDALGPEEPLLADGANDVNENSVVVRLTYRCAACARPFRMLFMGDAGAQSEARMLATGADLEADVLKVGHHGSGLVDARVHRRDPASLRADQRGPPQPFRTSRADYLNHAAATRRKRLSYRSLRSDLRRGWDHDPDNAHAQLSIALQDPQTLLDDRSPTSRRIVRRGQCRKH